MNYNTSETQDGLVYDLRQKYAEIIGAILEEIAIAIKEKRFRDWYELIDDSLICEVDQQLTPKEKKYYRKIKRKTLMKLMEYEPAFMSQSTEPMEVYYVKESLKRLYKWVRNKMQKHKMFGAKEEVEDW